MAAEPRSAIPQNLILENRKRLSVSGVEEVLGFDEAGVRMKTVLGDLIVQGEELNVESLSVDSGEILITGRVDELIFEVASRSGGLWARLFRPGENGT